MNEEKIMKLMKSIDIEVAPREELKENITTIIRNISSKEHGELSSLESLLFRKPLKAAACMAVCISTALWVLMGSNYTSFLYSLINVR